MRNFIWPNSKEISRQMDEEKDRFYFGSTLLAFARGSKRLLKTIDKLVESIGKLARHKLQC